MPDRKLPMSELKQMKPVMGFLAFAVWTGWLNFLGMSLAYAVDKGGWQNYWPVVVVSAILPFIEWPLLLYRKIWKIALITIGLAAGFAIQFLLKY